MFKQELWKAIEKKSGECGRYLQVIVSAPRLTVAKEGSSFLLS